MKIMKEETISRTVTICDICGEEISGSVIPARITRTRMYDGGNVLKNMKKIYVRLFKVPVVSDIFTFHQECADNAIFKEMKNRRLKGKK